MTDKAPTIIRVDEDNRILNIEDIPYPQRMTMIRQKAITCLRDEDGKPITLKGKPVTKREHYVNYIDLSKVNAEYATIMRDDEVLLGEEPLSIKDISKMTKKEMEAFIKDNASRLRIAS